MKIEQIRVDGGASVDNLLMQFQADILGVSIVRPRMTETTAMGVCISRRAGCKILER